jgi:hypothetical protein
MLINKNKTKVGRNHLPTNQNISQSQPYAETRSLQQEQDQRFLI